MKINKKNILSEPNLQIPALFLSLVKSMPIHEAVFWLNKENQNAFVRNKDLTLISKAVDIDNYNFQSYKCDIKNSDEKLILVANRSFTEQTSTVQPQLFDEEDTQALLLPKSQIFDIIIYSTHYDYSVLTKINLPKSIFFSYLVDSLKKYKTLQKFIIQNE